MAEDPLSGNPNNPIAVKAASEIRLLIDDLDLRINRQQKRVQKIIINREGPADEMQALLNDMIKSRDVMKAQLQALEGE